MSEPRNRAVARAPFVGREELMGECLAAMSAPDAAGVELVGLAGSGKSRAASVIADALVASRGHAVSWVSANPVLAEVPFGALSPLGAMAGIESFSAENLFPALLDALVAGSGPQGRHLLVVDDVQFLDPDSDRLLAEVAAEGAVAVLSTRRAGSGRPPESLSAPLLTCEVEPLDRVRTSRMVQALLGGVLEPSVTEAVWARSGGLPFFIELCVQAALQAGAVVDEGTGWRFIEEHFDARSTSVSLTVDAALGTDPAIRRAAGLLAIADPISVRHLVELVGPDAVSHLERSGLARRVSRGNRDDLQMGHPLYGEVLRAETGSLARRSLLVDLVGAAPPLAGAGPLERARVARWQLEAGLVDAAESVELARAALAVTDWILAERLARVAFDLAPSPEAAGVLARALHEQGRFDESDGYFDLAISAATDDIERVELLALRVWRPFDDPAQAEDLVDRLAAEAEDPRWRVFATVYPGWMLVLGGQPRLALSRCTALWEGRADLSAVDRAELATMVLGARLMAGDLRLCREAYVELEPEAPGPPPGGWFDRVPIEHTFWGFALALQGRDEEALPLLEQQFADGSGAARAWSSFAIAQVHQTAGRFREAIAWYRASLREPFVRAVRVPMVAAALVECGLLLDAPQPGRIGRPRLAEGRLPDIVAGRIARLEALEMGAAGRPVGERAARLRVAHAQLRPIESWALESEVLVELAFLGEVTAGEGRRMAELVARVGGPLPTARLGLVTAVAEHRPEAIALAASELERVGARWEAARAHELASLRIDHRPTAASHADRARTLAEECSVAPAFLPLPGRTVTLPARERAVLELLVGGATNAEVAAELDSTPRVVARLIERLYLRVGVTNRSGLAAVVGSGGAAGPGLPGATALSEDGAPT